MSFQSLCRQIASHRAGSDSIILRGAQQLQPIATGADGPPSTGTGADNDQGPPPCEAECDAAQGKGWTQADGDSEKCKADPVCNACDECMQSQGPPPTVGTGQSGTAAMLHTHTLLVVSEISANSLNQ